MQLLQSRSGIIRVSKRLCTIDPFDLADVGVLNRLRVLAVYANQVPELIPQGIVDPAVTGEQGVVNRLQPGSLAHQAADMLLGRFKAAGHADPEETHEGYNGSNS